MSRKEKNQSLSNKIVKSFKPQALLDPELNSEDDTTAKLVDIDSDDSDYENITAPKQFSKIRKQNIKLLSEESDKYQGVISSRRELEDDEFYESSDSTSNDANSDLEDDLADKKEDTGTIEKYMKKFKNCQIQDDSLSTDDDNDDDNEHNATSNNYDSDYGSSGDDLSESGDVSEEQNVISEADKSQEIQKGRAIQNQLKLWEKLLEMRIQSQKILLKANMLPFPEQHKQMADNNVEFATSSKETVVNVEKLLEKLLETQKLLAQQYSETKDLVKPSAPVKNLKRSSNDKSDEPDPKKFAETLKDNFEHFRPYRNSVLQKWHDRTKILTPGSANRSENFDIVQKIDAALLNKNDLIKKSQQNKSGFRLFGSKTEETKNEDTDDYFPEIYDDTDFYHQLLRELIEFKTNLTDNPQEISKKFIELQKLRHKMKKKVDTRASKGRKIRYVVHNKLMNFMAPLDNSDWTDESKNELYRSLFTE